MLYEMGSLEDDNVDLVKFSYMEFPVCRLQDRDTLDLGRFGRSKFKQRSRLRLFHSVQKP